MKDLHPAAPEVNQAGAKPTKSSICILFRETEGVATLWLSKRWISRQKLKPFADWLAEGLTSGALAQVSETVFVDKDNETGNAAFWYMGGFVMAGEWGAA
jgi:hypothetical protein